MPAKKDSRTQKNSKDRKNDKKIVKKVVKNVEKKEKSNLQKTTILQKNIGLSKEDKMLEKVEKYVDKNREKTSKEMLERRSKRDGKKYKKGDLELLISRVDVESKPNNRTKETSKLILYIIYALIIIAILIFIVNFFFAGNMPQNG